MVPGEKSVLYEHSLYIVLHFSVCQIKNILYFNLVVQKPKLSWVGVEGVLSQINYCVGHDSSDSDYFDNIHIEFACLGYIFLIC